MHTNFAVGNVAVKAKDEHVINAIFNAIFKNTDEWTNSFRVEEKPEMKEKGLEYRKFAYYGDVSCDKSAFLFMVNVDRMLKLWMPKIHNFLVANEFTISFKFVNCCVRAQLLVGMTIEIHHNAGHELTVVRNKSKDKTLFDFDETNISYMMGSLDWAIPYIEGADVVNALLENQKLATKMLNDLCWDLQSDAHNDEQMQNWNSFHDGQHPCSRDADEAYAAAESFEENGDIKTVWDVIKKHKERLNKLGYAV